MPNETATIEQIWIDRWATAQDEIKRLRRALEAIAILAPKPGGVGETARDALRISR